MVQRLVVLFVLGLAAVPALAQSGKLAGTVVDEAGVPVIGATVVLVGTTTGSVTDVDGRYVILNISPGAYAVRFSYIGYQTKIVSDIPIRSNQTTEQNVVLAEEVIEGEEVVVTAERPLVDVSLTSSMTTLSSEDIAVLPVQALDDIVNLQAGVVDGHFRGGRLGEVQYQVEGVSVNNPYDNRSTLTLDRSVLQEVQVISGTFDAEYGQAMSGVVNAVLRTGDARRYEFTFETYLGDFFSPGNDSVEVRTALDGVQTVALFPHIDEVDPFTRQNYQASLSGPVPLVPGTTFLVNGQRYVGQGHLLGRRVFLPTDRADFEQRVFTPSGDSALVAMSYQKQWSFLGKLSNRSIPNVQLDYQAIGNVVEQQGYSHSFRFNPEGLSPARRFSIVHGLDVTHTLSNTLFYDISVRQNYFDYRDLRYDDVHDPRYVEEGQPRGDANFEEGAVVQGVDLGRFVQETDTYVLKATVTGQATRSHLLKGGVELQSSALAFGSPGQLVQTVRDGVQQLLPLTDTLDAQVRHYDPRSAAAFVQDRIEWNDLRVRAGLRLEYFDANTTVPSDLQNPANSIDGAPTSTPKATTAKVVLAPRLGISFPILDRASLFFSYGHFYQMPGLGQIFSNADYSILEDLQAGAVDYGVMGNPDLKPEFTSQYEFGFKSEVAGFLGLDLSLFYKDIRDLLGVEFIQTYTAAEYARLTNVDFGGVRGLTLAVDQRGTGPLSTSLDYTLQVAVGNASDARETANRAAAGEDPRPRQVPFNWDQRHTLNGSVVWFVPGSLSVTAIARLASGQPYTPALGQGFGAELEDNSGRKPAFLTVDLRAEKFFSFGGLSWTAFGRVFNLFDAHYANGFVYADTGSAYYTLNPAQQRNPNPARLNAPRRVEIGVSLRGAFAR